MDGSEVVKGVSAVNVAFMEFGVDSSKKNLAEYIGAIAVIGQVMLRFSGTGIALRGDRVGALTWTMTERPRGLSVTNTSMLWTLLCIAADAKVFLSSFRYQTSVSYFPVIFLLFLFSFYKKEEKKKKKRSAPAIRFFLSLSLFRSSVASTLAAIVYLSLRGIKNTADNARLDANSVQILATVIHCQ
jgi:hypothetical protein